MKKTLKLAGDVRKIVVTKVKRARRAKLLEEEIKFLRQHQRNYFSHEFPLLTDGRTRGECLSRLAIKAMANQGAVSGWIEIFRRAWNEATKVWQDGIGDLFQFSDGSFLLFHADEEADEMWARGYASMKDFGDSHQYEFNFSECYNENNEL